MASQTTEMQNYGLSSSDHSYIYSDSDDSEEDPTFDLLKQNCSSFSRLSVKKSSKSRIVKEKNEDTEGEEHVQEMVVPELDEKDQKNYDIIQKVIEGGQVQKLKVDQCKIYLRKHGLRLTGTKDILIKRIEEHLNILNGGGEMKYPPSSFVVNCKGDACTGDVVLFEQNVYEMFSIAGRCANGPPCGTRMVVGRIVKESYGAAKQQHTFTIEVLWSKGEKPLPPLHPLLIKGRNLYRLKTMRRKWEDEGERQKMLTEKHARGGVARSERETRVQNKEMRKKMPKSNRNSETTSVCRNEEETRNQKLNPISITSKKPQQLAEKMQHTDQAQCFIDRPTASLKAANMPLDRPHFERQPLTSMNSNKEFEAVKSSFQGHNKNSVQKNYYPGNTCFSPSWRWSARQPQVHDRVLRHENKNSQICRYYAQGRCYYGQNCRYLHQS